MICFFYSKLLDLIITVPVIININKSVTQILNGSTIKGSSPPLEYTSFFTFSKPLVNNKEYKNRINPPFYWYYYKFSVKN